MFSVLPKIMVALKYNGKFPLATETQLRRLFQDHAAIVGSHDIPI